MPRIKKPLPIDQLSELFYCDYDSGILRWKNPPGPRVAVGDVVYAKPSSSGYLSIETFAVTGRRERYLVHRVLWSLYHGEDLGNAEIDHIDGDKTNNSIYNLRLATPSQNQYNRKQKGFYWHKNDKKWRACINIDGVRTVIGSYTCPLLARLAYVDKSKEIAGAFSPY